MPPWVTERSSSLGSLCKAWHQWWSRQYETWGRGCPCQYQGSQACLIALLEDTGPNKVQEEGERNNVIDSEHLCKQKKPHLIHLNSELVCITWSHSTPTFRIRFCNSMAIACSFSIIILWNVPPQHCILLCSVKHAVHSVKHTKRCAILTTVPGKKQRTVPATTWPLNLTPDY